MRLDKYLKVTRLIKRRTIANEACDAGRVLVNGKVARASYEVKEDDVIEIQLGQRPLKVQVVSVTESPRKEEAAQNYKGKKPHPLRADLRTDICVEAYGNGAQKNADAGEICCAHDEPFYTVHNASGIIY